MSTKWLSRLSKDDILNLHKYAGGENAVKCIRVEPNGDESMYVTFLEDWPDHTGKSILEEIDYELDDFDGELTYDGGSTKDVGDFREWMIRKFKSEYIFELVKEKLGTNIIDYLKWSEV